MLHSYFDEPFQTFGMWWLPGQESAESGELRYDSAEGLQLTVVGEFRLRGDVNAAPKKIPLVLGRIVDSRIDSFVTLIGCTQTGSKGLLGSIGTRRYAVNRAYFGAHLESETDFTFDRVEIHGAQFANWITESSLHVSVELGEHDLPVEHTVKFADDHRGEGARVGNRIVSFDFLRTSPIQIFRSVTISEDPFIDVRYDTATDVDTILRESVFPLQNLSTLASDRPSRLSGVILRRNDARPGPRDVHLLYRQIPSPTGPVQPLYAQEMLVMTHDVPFTRLVENWLPFAGVHRDICDLYFSVMYSPGLLCDAAFFMLAQVAEEYHRERHAGTEIAKEEHAKRCAAILAGTPKEHRAWLGEKLKYTNERSFRKRVRKLVSLDATALTPFLGKVRDFVDVVVNTRNYMAHRTEELRKKAAHGIDLVRLNERLRLLLKACFLRELGCAENERAVLVARHASLNSWLRS